MSARLRGLFLLFALVPAPALAADPKPSETALSKVPADAEFYSSTLRLGETIQIIGKSQLWQQTWNDPTIQEFVKKFHEQAGGEGLAPILKFFADPANAELPALALDAFSNEIFAYSGAGTGELLALFQELVGGARYGPAFQQLLNQGGGGDPTRERARIVLLSLSEKPERVRLPDMVLGFKVSDPAKVSAQLKRIDPLLNDALKDSPLKGRVKRVKIGDDEFLTLNLDGSLVPWDEVPLKMFEDKEGEFDRLLKHFKQMKLTISLGVKEGYLLVSVGHSTDGLAKFGGAGPKLISRPELKPISAAAAAGKPITSISYAAAKLREPVATTAEDIQGYVDLAQGLLDQAMLPDDLSKAVMKDVKALAKEYTSTLVKPGAVVLYSFRTGRGWETFSYDYTPTAGPPQTKPLTLLNHVGGAPLIAAVWRSGTTIEDYRNAVKWISVFGDHGVKIISNKAPEAAPVVEMVQKDIFPLLKEMSGITEKLWFPALDGQEGIVIDAKWTSKQWHAALPETKIPLPMLEFGVVLGVSDAAKLQDALEGYRVTVNKIIAKVQELAPPGSIPAFEIPKPTVEKKAGRTFAFYPIPEELGVDKQFQPTGGLSERVAALTLSRGHTERLLDSTPLVANLVPFADAKKPLDSAFYMNWAGIVNAASPWVFHAIDSAELGDNKEQAQKIAQRVIRTLRVFQSYGSATYREGGATVTHSEAVFEDVPALPPGK